MASLQLAPGAAIPWRALTRHVGIFGATGSGKTNSALLLAQRAPCPVIILDAKGDLGATVAPRLRVDAMRPELIARALDLTEAQAGALYIALAWAEDTRRPVATLADLRRLLSDAMAADLSAYGLISSVSVGALQRSFLRIERDAPWLFSAAPMPDPRDTTGITVYAAHLIADMPGAYGAFAAHLLDTLYQGLGEIGDTGAPGLLVLIDEAHLLFDGAAPGIVRRIEQVTRLIRSKGVGLVYVTQSPADLPDAVLGQLGTRLQHSLRGATERQRKALRAAAETMPGEFTAADIMGLGIGEALVSVGASPAQRVRVDMARPVARASVDLAALERARMSPYTAAVFVPPPSHSTKSRPWRYWALGLALLLWGSALLLH